MHCTYRFSMLQNPVPKFCIDVDDDREGEEGDYYDDDDDDIAEKDNTDDDYEEEEEEELAEVEDDIPLRQLKRNLKRCQKL